MINLNTNYEFVTNNILVFQNFGKIYNVNYFDGKYLDVLVKARDLIHSGYNMITHPLMGSVKPNETPYRTIILEKSQGINFQSLEIIENSIDAYLRFQCDKLVSNWNERVLHDFRVIDEDLIKNAILSINF